jgi:hypothetical protein
MYVLKNELARNSAVLISKVEGDHEEIFTGYHQVKDSGDTNWM